MSIFDDLYNEFEQRAENIKITKLIIGLSYTAVELSNENSGLSFTWKESGCQSLAHDDNFSPEGKNAIEYLHYIKSNSPLKKSIAIAIINALNHEYTENLQDDDDNNSLFSFLNITNNSRISMVGLIAPLVKKMKEKGATPEILDHDKKVGEKSRFLKGLKNSDILIITSSAILEQGFQDILDSRNKSTQTVLIGPTTPMTASLFKKANISILAGSHTLTEFNNEIFREVAHGKGTPVLKKFSKKKIIKLI